MRQLIPLAKAYRLLNHGPMTLISSAHNGRSNVMAAAWAMPLDFDPPRVAVVVDKNALTRELIEASGEFALNIPCRQIATASLRAGSIKARDLGEDGDKWSETGLTNFPAEKIAAPLVDGCVGWLECRIIPEPHNEKTYDLFIAEVVVAWADTRVFTNGRWHFDAEEDLRTLHYVAGRQFFATGESITV